MVDEGLELGLRFGEGFDLRGVGLIDFLHALEAGGLGDGEGVDLFGVVGDDGGELGELLGEAVRR